MRLPTWWGLGMGVLLLCHLGTRPPRLGAAEPAPARLVVDALCQALPSRCPPGAAQPPVDDLQTRAGPLLEPAASVPLEDPLASDCWYVGLQTEWVASKRDAGLPLSEVLRAARRVFALDLPWQSALAGALGTLIYRAPQRSPAELRQTIEAACLAPPLFWTDDRADW